MLGGGVTAIFSSEGNMVIEEGGKVDYTDDYHRMELCFVNLSLQDSLEYTVFDEELLVEGNTISYDKLGLEIDIISRIKNTRIQNRITEVDSVYKGFLKQFVLLPKEPGQKLLSTAISVRRNNVQHPSKTLYYMPPTKTEHGCKRGHMQSLQRRALHEQVHP